MKTLLVRRENMDVKDKINLRDVEITFKDKFSAHPIRFILTIPLYGLTVYYLILLIGNFSLGGLVTFIIATVFLTFWEWIVYGPINISKLKKEKQMEIMTEYITQNGNKVNEENTVNKRGTGYCHQCGQQIKSDWKVCPHCGVTL